MEDLFDLLPLLNAAIVGIKCGVRRFQKLFEVQGIDIEQIDHADRVGFRLGVLTQRWQKPGDVTPLKNIANRNQATQSTSRFVQDNNEFSINSISLSYDFNPEWVKRIGLDVLRIQASTNDLVTFSSIKQERGLDYPFARTFNLGLSVSF